MESEKVKEIKKYFEERDVIYFADILTYINELERENEKLLESCKNCHYIKDLEIANGHAKELKDRIAELEKEIKGNVFYAKGYAEGIKNTYEVVMPNKLKQFAERLKEKLEENSPIAGYDLEDLEFDGETIQECIDETLKEFLGK